MADMEHTTRMLRCRQCGCIQTPSNLTCKNCGEDLTLFGDFVKSAPENTGGGTGQAASPGKSGKTRRKKAAGRKAVWKTAIPALLIAVAAGISIWAKQSKPAPRPAPQIPSISATAPATRPGTDVGTAPGTETGTTPAAPAGTLVVGEADLSGFNQLPKDAVPDLYYWSGGRAAYRDEPSESGEYYKYETDQATVDKFIEMLQKNGFTLVDSYDFTYKMSFYSWGFCCDAMPGAQTIPLQYKDTPCHVCLYFAGDEGEYTMVVSPDLRVCDTGVRYDGTTADLRPSGPSVAAGLILLPDGSYQTSDGRLTASVGTAMVLRDGVSCVKEAKYAVEDGDEVIRIENIYRNEGIYFQTPERALMQGDILTQRDLRRWRWRNLKTMEDLAGYRWNNAPMMAMPRDGIWHGPTFNEDVYKAQTVRVMTYDPGGIGVFYFYSSFLKGEPREVEALCVVDMAQKNGPIGDGIYVTVGGSTTVKFTDREYFPAWELYDWIILEGADKISIDPSRESCKVTGLAPGVASIQVTYDYGKEEPDVLTGIPRTVGRKKTKTYHFIVE